MNTWKRIWARSIHNKKDANVFKTKKKIANNAEMQKIMQKTRKTRNKKINAENHIFKNIMDREKYMNR
jgi:hypothetical protein